MEILESADASRRDFRQPRLTHADKIPVPTAKQILDAFRELGTRSSVATFFGVSRWTIDRWNKKLNLHPEVRPEIPIRQLLSGFLSDSTSRVRVAQWIVDEASISIAYSLRFDTSSLMVVGAMNDSAAMDIIAKQLGVRVVSGAVPPSGRLPTHILRVQGARACSLLGILSNELTGLKALEAEAALAFFPPSGLVKGKVTTDAYMGSVWRRFARESAELWNARRRSKLSQLQIDEIVDAWVLNRTGRARRGIGERKQARALPVSTSATP
jgi:hypothetical protein